MAVANLSAIGFVVAPFSRLPRWPCARIGKS
jgi:hypothetical protein